LVLGLGGA
jgi:hypothetical protein